MGFVHYNKKAEQHVKIEDITLDDIRKIQTDFIIAAEKFDYAGFDGIQIALGNYYFLTRFINPYFNKRDDKYGGNTLNRLRIVLEIIKVLKKNTNLHINCRLNAFDIQKGGMTIDDTVEVAQILEKYGVDSLQITRPRSPQYFSRENYHKSILANSCNKIIEKVDIPVIMGGGIKSQNQINNVLNKTNVDFISMQRPFVADPSFLVDWKIEGNGEVKCKTCNNCYWKKTSTCFLYPKAQLNVSYSSE